MLETLYERLRNVAHWRCQEPVLIFESDDWGFERKASSAVLKQFGTPGERADEALETPEDLDKLYRVLETYQDPTGRPACFVANFITANPDFDAIAASRFSAYHDLPIGLTSAPALQQKWQEGLARKTFYPQYHGRSHIWPELWLQDVRADVPGARALFDARCNLGLSLLQEYPRRYHSEYINWSSGQLLTDNALLAWVRTGMDYFKQAFGYTSVSTIAPHYLFTNQTCQVWRQLGIHYVQGTNDRAIWRSKPMAHSDNYLRHTLGEKSPTGLCFLTRTVRFEPRLTRTDQDVKHAVQLIDYRLCDHLPIIVDTHRINFTGSHRDNGLSELAMLLDVIRKYHPYILTSVELGQAIQQNGMYQDIWTGEVRRLTPLETPLRRAACTYLRYYNHRSSVPQP
ncbi:MAG: hypothetical protein IT324_22430 [Anaerolineae bacterium]|nr:hypothetical protein [Anaerolineae bacterium]